MEVVVYTFENAVADAAKLVSSLTNEEKLKLYALYKQATVGDVNTPAPGYFDFTGTAKWKAWGELKGKAQECAKSEYAELVSIHL
jgi:diazepam-binding inhibitor (GABA receptor modulating acyl-CoA-binding protein)